MPTTDYTTLTPEQWEDLGRRLREATAEVSSPLPTEVTAELQGLAAIELRRMAEAIMQRSAEIQREHARRQDYLAAALIQVNAVLRG